MELFETLQKKHIELIEIAENPELSKDQLSARIESFIEELKSAGALIVDSRQRNQLRTLLRYWGSVLYEQKGEFPNTQLLPLNAKIETQANSESKRRRWRTLIVIVGIFGLLIVLGIVLFELSGLTITPTPTLTVISTRPEATNSLKQFSYIVNVLDKDTQESIKGAEVSIQIGAEAVGPKITDARGQVVFTFAPDQADQGASLIVKAKGYEEQILNIALKLNSPTEIVQLSPLVKVPTPTDTSIPTETPTPQSLQLTDTPMPTETPTPQPSQPTDTPTETATVVSTGQSEISFKSVTAIHPTTQESVQALDSIWKLIKFQNLEEPGTQTYEITIEHNKRLRWDFFWCAEDEKTLTEIMIPFELDFRINDTALPDNIPLQYTRPASYGWLCNSWATELAEWQKGETVKLEINYYLQTSIYDGKTEYPSGQYKQIVFVKVN